MQQDDRKNVSPAISLITVSLFFILLFIFAKWGPAINFSTTTQTKGEPFIVSGQGKVYAVPDIAKFTVGVTDSGSYLKTVETSVNTKSKALTDSVKKLGVKEEDIKTTSYNLYPQYDYNSPSRSITGYNISTTYQITVRDLDKVNDIITAATGSGANMEGNISFDINEQTKNDKLNEARRLAVEDAKKKAQGLAGSAGITLGKIINISESQNLNEIRPLYDLAAGKGSGPSAAPVANIQPGQTEINTTVSLSYEIR